MYLQLFENQSALEDADFEKYATKIGVDMKTWKSCVAAPDAVAKVIDQNFESGAKYGVTGTPAFFINGRKLSGALPYAEFKRVIDDELNKKKS
jgi:protein-disulfide isomerase